MLENYSIYRLWVSKRCTTYNVKRRTYNINQFLICKMPLSESILLSFFFPQLMQRNVCHVPGRIQNLSSFFNTNSCFPFRLLQYHEGCLAGTGRHVSATFFARPLLPMRLSVQYPQSTCLLGFFRL